MTLLVSSSLLWVFILGTLINEHAARRERCRNARKRPTPDVGVGRVQSVPTIAVKEDQ